MTTVYDAYNILNEKYHALLKLAEAVVEAERKWQISLNSADDLKTGHLRDSLNAANAALATWLKDNEGVG